MDKGISFLTFKSIHNEKWTGLEGLQFAEYYRNLKEDIPVEDAYLRYIDEKY